MKRVWILYDERARTEGTDNAAVLVSASKRLELYVDSKTFEGQNAIWAEYEVAVDGLSLTNEKLKPELYSRILRARAGRKEAGRAKSISAKSCPL